MSTFFFFFFFRGYLILWNVQKFTKVRQGCPQKISPQDTEHKTIKNRLN